MGVGRGERKKGKEGLHETRMLSNELLSPTQNANTEQKLYNEVFFFAFFFCFVGGGL